MAEIKEQSQIVVYITPDEFDIIDRALDELGFKANGIPAELKEKAQALWTEWERK